MWIIRINVNNPKLSDWLRLPVTCDSCETLGLNPFAGKYYKE